MSESQRDSVSKPRVAPPALPWVTVAVGTQPQRGCGHSGGRRHPSHNPVGVGEYVFRSPRVARSSQPWALGHNPFGIARHTTRWLLALFVLSILNSQLSTASAQTYSVDWFALASGGGTSTGGVYTVAGTFGQPDAGGPMQGGGYSVEGGFWSFYAPVGPVFLTEPAATNNVVTGYGTVLSVSVSGTPPFSYQWYFNGAPLSYGTNATLALTNFSAASAGTYDVAVSNAAGGVVSAPFVVSLLTFSVDWFTVAGGGGTSTSGIYTVSGMFGQSDAGPEMQGGGYAVDGGFWSPFAEVVPVLPDILASPTNTTVEAGDTTVLSVSASGTEPLSYQWYFDGTALSQATNATLALTNFLAGSVGTYQVAVSNAAGGVLCAPFTVAFPIYTVDWFKVAGGGGTSTGGGYAVNGTFGQQDAGGPMDGGGYSVESGFWSSYALQSSSAMGNAPVITAQPQSVIIPPGNPVAFTVSVSGTPPFLYQWQKNGGNLTDGGNVFGSATATLTLNPTTFNDTGNYSVIIENTYGRASSSVAKLTLVLPAYSITDMGDAFAYGINNSGQVTGYSFTNGHAFLYSGGTMTNLGTLGGSESWGESINNSGQVVGYSYTAVIYPGSYYGYAQVHAFLYSGGTMTDLGVLGVSTQEGSSDYGQSYAYGINDSGEVVGQSTTASGSTHAFLYSGGQMTDLDPSSGSLTSVANGINASGQIVGFAAFGNFDAPALFNGGNLFDLGTIGGTFGEAQVVNNSGQVAGYADTTGNAASHAFLYSGGPLTDLGTLGGSYSYAFGINSSGQVVGYAATTGNAAEHAFLYSGGMMFDLNNLVNTNAIGANFYFFQANGINDSGQIIAYGSSGHSYLLTPIQPEAYLAANLQPKFQTQTMTATGGNFTFSWNVVNAYPAVGYQVQYTTNLIAPNWLNLGGVLTGAAAPLSATDSNGADQQRFYRVLLVQ